MGSYQIEQQLGQGGMAVVYEARHVVLGKRVAIKMLLPHHAARSDLVARFQREGEAAALLEHPHAAAVFDAGRDQRGMPYLVLEHLEGEHLAALLMRAGSMTVQETLDLLLPVIAAIALAHDLGIVHRDLKPENVFLARRRGRLVPKVLDFGISKTATGASLKLTRSESLLGTPHYMSPEQAQGADQADARSDQFALGVIMYECVTGQCPFEGSSLFAVLAAIVGGTLTPPSRLVRGLDPTFESIVMRALSKDPAERFPDLRGLALALLPLASLRVRLGYEREFLTAPETGPSTPSDAASEPPWDDDRLSESRLTVAAPRCDVDALVLEHGSEVPVSPELLTVGSGRRSMAIATVLIGSSLLLAALASVALALSDETSTQAVTTASPP